MLTNYAWASKIRPGRPQCLLSFGRTEGRLRPTRLSFEYPGSAGAGPRQVAPETGYSKRSRMCLYFSRGRRFTNLGSRQARFEARACSPRPPGSSRLRASSLALHPPRCTPRPRAKKFVQQVRAREESAPAKCHPDQRSARQQGRQDKHRDPGETDRAAAA
ncbi:uncharacterized protein LOC129659454 isoform X2 [Bubalus kerabau]|uniref:uncharacterized protein LOC129659454 isoform X2 n=1 Tax=Bubalus carabanensis TaxID=3119969 RepID=UPI00244EB45B|nr:uncharacterized protein LOC129659454 isoform X2 [Bubalus carabanensis]